MSFGADFLGDFHGGFEKQFIAGRKPAAGKMSYHVQFESQTCLLREQMQINVWLQNHLT